MNNKSETEFFIRHFLSHKIKSGEKQVNIVESAPHVLKQAFISKLHNGRAKSIPVEKQSAIASYFGVTVEQMVEEGRKIYFQDNNRRKGTLFIRASDKPSTNLSGDDMINLLNRVAGAIKKNEYDLKTTKREFEKCRNQTQSLEICKKILENLDIGILFFDVEKQFSFSNYEEDTIEGIKLKQGDTIDSILIYASKKIINFQDIVEFIESFKTDKTPKSLTIQFTSKVSKKFKIQVINSEVGERLGTIVTTKK